MTTDAKPPPDDPTPVLSRFALPGHAPRRPNTRLLLLKWVMVAVLIGLVAALVLGLWGHARWVTSTNTRLQALESATPKTRSERYDDTELARLPPVVRRYLSQALNPNQPIVRRVYLEQSGTLRRGNAQDGPWEPFSARQRVATKRPGFVWDASVTLSGGIALRLIDAYVAGEGSWQPSVIGLFDVAGSQGTGDLARAALIRYFAESVWYPTALLPSQGVSWTAVDARTAQATLSDGALRVSLLFAFDAQGLVESIRSVERSALVDGALVPMPWEVRLSNYQAHSGMRVPQEAEAAWLAPSGRRPYWRGTIEKLDYDMPR